MSPPWRAFGPVYWLTSIGAGIIIALLVMLAIGWLP